MATLIGRECWIGEETLFHGVIRDEWHSGIKAVDEKGRIALVERNKVALDRLGAIRICQDAMEYWHQEREQLEKEIVEGKG